MDIIIGKQAAGNETTQVAIRNSPIGPAGTNPQAASRNLQATTLPAMPGPGLSRRYRQSRVCQTNPIRPAWTRPRRPRSGNQKYEARNKFEKPMAQTHKKRQTNPISPGEKPAVGDSGMAKWAAGGMECRGEE